MVMWSLPELPLIVTAATGIVGAGAGTIVMGSSPVYTIVFASNVRVPELALLAVDDTEEWLPLMTRVSNPPVPPSIRPESAPPAATTNVSLLPALPVRLSKPLNARAPTVPALGPVNVHVVSAVGPLSVFPVPLAAIAETFENVTPPVPARLTVPPAPLRETAAPEPSNVRVLLPAPPSNETARAVVPTVRA